MRAGGLKCAAAAAGPAVAGITGMGSLSGLTNSSMQVFKNAVSLSAPFNPVLPAYWNNMAHQRKIPMACNPDGSACAISWLDSTKTNVYVQGIDPTTFANVGPVVKVNGGLEAGGLVVQANGEFAVLVNRALSGWQWPISLIIQYKGHQKLWETKLNGPGIHADVTETGTPDINGDLVWDPNSKYYGAYFIVTGVTKDFKGHFGDSIAYVDRTTGQYDLKANGTSAWGCSHNLGIAMHATPEIPYVSLCEDDGQGIYLNTGGTGMWGERVSNENSVNGQGTNAFGGSGQFYSSIAAMGDGTFLAAWRSRGSVKVRGNPDRNWNDMVMSDPRWLNGNVAFTKLANKDHIAGPPATSVHGTADGDKNHGWWTYSANIDHTNVHIQAINGDYALVTWQETPNPKCEPLPSACTGQYAGTVWALVDKAGKLVGSKLMRQDVKVSGTMTQLKGKVCWPYAEGPIDFTKPVDPYSGEPIKTVDHISIACIKV